MTQANKEKKFLFEYFKSVLNYDFENAILTWKFRDAITHGDKTFNGKLAGKEAGVKDPDGYTIINIDNRRFFAHRLIYLLMTGNWPKDEFGEIAEIDHINGDPSDNRWKNLRVVNRKENLKNKKIGKNNTSGVSGVYWNKRLNKWRVQISVNKKLISLGHFHDFNEAVKVRKEAEKKYGYHENHGRPNN